MLCPARTLPYFFDQRMLRLVVQSSTFKIVIAVLHYYRIHRYLISVIFGYVAVITLASQSCA